MSYKDLVPLEEVNKILESIHSIDINGRKTCQPCSINKLTKNFNDKYHFKGLQKEATSFLKKCLTCKMNNVLPQTAPPPPIPIRSYFPLQRLQFDLIHIATKKRNYLGNNQWGFKYIYP